MKTVAAIRFLLELAVVAGVAVAGARWSWFVAILAPVAFVVVSVSSAGVAAVLRVTGAPWETEARE
jgi:hypothetical protein